MGESSARPSFSMTAIFTHLWCYIWVVVVIDSLLNVRVIRLQEFALCIVVWGAYGFAPSKGCQPVILERGLLITIRHHVVFAFPVQYWHL